LIYRQITFTYLLLLFVLPCYLHYPVICTRNQVGIERVMFIERCNKLGMNVNKDRDIQVL